MLHKQHNYYYDSVTRLFVCVVWGSKHWCMQRHEWQFIWWEGHSITFRVTVSFIFYNNTTYRCQKPNHAPKSSDHPKSLVCCVITLSTWTQMFHQNKPLVIKPRPALPDQYIADYDWLTRCPQPHNVTGPVTMAFKWQFRNATTSHRLQTTLSNIQSIYVSSMHLPMNRISLIDI